MVYKSSFLKHEHINFYLVKAETGHVKKKILFDKNLFTMQTTKASQLLQDFVCQK